MFALINRMRRRRFADESYADLGAASSFVMPRPMRRATRFLSGLASGRVYIPRHVGTASAFGFLAATAAYGMVLGGHTNSVAEATTAAAGFAVEDVKVSGNTETSEIEILQLLGLDGATSLVALNVDAARQKISALPWVENVEVRKVYPRTVEVKLKEKKAWGIWQHGSDLSLIEQDGTVIAPLRDNKFAKLPLFVGAGAEKDAADIVKELDGWPNIKSRVKAYARISDRRWDLYLDSGIVVKLPEDDVQQALTWLEKMESDQSLLERDIAQVDLRLSDRAAIGLTPDAEKRREAALQARTKALKKAGQDT